MDDDNDYVDGDVRPKKKGKAKARVVESEDELSEDEVVKKSSGNHKGAIRRSNRLKDRRPGPAQPGVQCLGVIFNVFILMYIFFLAF